MNNRKWSRIIAMLLAVMLVFCDSNVTYAVESMTEAQTEDPAAAQAAADAEAARQAEEAQAAAEAEAARQAAEAQAAADAEAARQAAEAQAAADAEAARQAAEAQAAADAEAARQAAEAQAAADAEAARQAEEAQAAADAEAARQAEEAQATADTATADSETEPQTTPSATGSLTLKTEAVSTQKEGEAAKLKVTYELSADSSVNAVETRLYAWNKNAGYPQFKDGKFTDPETKREFQLKTDKDGLVYVEYILKKGESFTEEFEFIDTTLEVGTQITFDVAIGANGVVPANCSIQSTTAKVTYALPDGNGTATEVETESNAPESAAVENTVAFQSAEGASVTVDGADVTNGTAMAKDGKIIFTVTPAEGYEVTSILVDGTIPARTNDETPETNDYIIEGIQTDSTVVVISTQAVVVESETESETATEAATEVESESESETEAVTESESETVVETESESETETVAETEVETESETEAKYGTDFSYEDETVVITAVAQPEAKLPENAVLKADPMPEGSAAYEEAVSMVENQLGGTEEGQEASYVFYDVYFEVNGERIEPADGLVEVSMNFKTPVLESAEDETVDEVSVLHIKEDTNKVEEVTDNVEITDDGAVSAVGFSTDSFSVFGVRKMASVTPQAADNKCINDIASNVDYKILIAFRKADGTYGDYTPYDGTTPISRDDKIAIGLSYTYDNDGVKPTVNTKDGWYYDFKDLNGALKAAGLDLQDSKTGIISATGYPNAGTYIFDPDTERVTFNYAEGFLKKYKSDIKGTFNFECEVKKEEVSNKNETTITIGGHELKVSFKDTTLTGTKTYTIDADGNMVFQIPLTANDADANKVKVTDTLTGDLSFIEDSFEIDGVKVTPGSLQFSEDKKTVTVTVGDIPYGTTKTLTYKVKPNSLEAGNSNKATWNWGTGNSDGKGNNGESGVDIKFDNNRLNKSGVLGSNNRITYTIKVNELKEDLSEGSDWITLTDVISHENPEGSEDVYIIPLFESIKVLDGDTLDENTELIKKSEAGYTYDQAENKLTFKLPDERSLVITYDVMISGETGAKVPSISNKIIMKGKKIESVTETKHVTIE